MSELIDMNELSNFIRQIDGNHTMGAGMLAEKICEWIEVKASLSKQEAEPVDVRQVFISGFRYCAVEWAERLDLFSDVHSAKFAKEMDAILDSEGFLHPPKPAALPQPLCKTCGGTKVDPGGLLTGCRACTNPQPVEIECIGNCPHDVGDAYQRDCCHPDCLRPKQQPVASVPQDVEEFIAQKGMPMSDPSGVVVFVGFMPDDLRAWMAGHARVPVKPTHAMCLAGNALLPSSHNSDDIYKAVLTASKGRTE